jgi:hypothetical protein
MWMGVAGMCLLACTKNRPACGSRAHVVKGVRVLDALADEHGKRTAALTFEKSFCTAVVVSSRAVLTARHCVQGKKARELLFGADIRAPQFRRPVLTSAAHPTEDIAVVQFAGGLPTGFLATRLAPPEFGLKSGERITITGFGFTLPSSSKGSGTLSKTVLPFRFSRIDPQKWDVATMPLLWLDATQGSGACHGDSGGPAFVERGSVWFVVGVTQGGDGLCGNEFNRATDLRLVHSWVHTHIALGETPGLETSKLVVVGAESESKATSEDSVSSSKECQ